MIKYIKSHFKKWMKKWQEEKIFDMETLPSCLKRKIWEMAAVFTIVVLLLLILTGRDIGMIFFSLLLALVGVFLTVRLYFQATRGYIFHISGIIIEINRNGWRMQEKVLHIQDAADTVYAVTVQSRFSGKYKVGNTVSFYLDKHYLDQAFYQDGEYHIPSVVSIENTDVSIHH